MRAETYALATQKFFLWLWVPVEGERVHCLLSSLPGETDLQPLVSGFDYGSLVGLIALLFHWLQLLGRYLNHVQCCLPEQHGRSQKTSDLKNVRKYRTFTYKRGLGETILVLANQLFSGSSLLALSNSARLRSPPRAPILARSCSQLHGVCVHTDGIATAQLGHASPTHLPIREGGAQIVTCHMLIHHDPVCRYVY